MRLCAAILVGLLAVIPHAGQNQSFVIGEISFFGYSGLPVDRVRLSLPIHEGHNLALQEVERTRQQIKASVTGSTGRPATDVAIVCCNHDGKMMIFVGLRGKSHRDVPYNRTPDRPVSLPQHLLDLNTRAEQLNREAVQKDPSEDRSKGYSLSNYPPLRETQMSLRQFALKEEPLLRRVLASAASPVQRQVAAYALGYAPPSKRQLAALVRASRDPNEGVRNDAVRALGVLAGANTKLAAQIPVEPFAAMLNSGLWTDRNKAAFLLNILTRPRNARVLRLVRSEAFQSLVEMARWKDPDHAWDARMILGRIAGIEEKRLQQLAATGVEK